MRRDSGGSTDPVPDGSNRSRVADQRHAQPAVRGLQRRDLKHAVQRLVNELRDPLERDHRHDPVTDVAGRDHGVARLPVRTAVSKLPRLSPSLDTSSNLKAMLSPFAGPDGGRNLIPGGPSRGEVVGSARD